MTIRNIWLAIASISVTLAACGQPAQQPAANGQDPAAARPGAGVVNLYSTRHYDSDRILYDGFTRATGIDVRVIEGRADPLIQRLREEGSASPADVVLMTDGGSLYRAQEAGLLQGVRSETLESRIPATLRDPQGRWFGFTRRARIIAYDPARVRPEEVATYEQIAGPRFRRQLCVRQPENPYNLSLVSALLQRWGPERAVAWARGLTANMARPPQGGDLDQIRAVAAGECQVALTNSYYFLRLAMSDNEADRAITQRLRLSFPDQAGEGTHVNISGGGVAANAPNRANAIRFLEYLASAEAQPVFVRYNAEFPAVAGTPMPEAVAAVANFRADPMPVATYGARQAEAQRLLDTVEGG